MLFHVVCRILYVLHGNVFPRTLPDSQKIPDFGRPWGGEVVVFLQDISEMNRTRATIKALPSAPHRSRPYGCCCACC